MEKEKPPVFGMIERGGQVVMHVLDNVKQKTIEPCIKDTMESGTLVYTDAYSIYARLERWGYAHKSVNHGRGEYARDEDGDGFCEVHVNTMEGFWSGRIYEFGDRAKPNKASKRPLTQASLRCNRW